jgi:hypothetical protein
MARGFRHFKVDLLCRTVIRFVAFASALLLDILKLSSQQLQE